MAAELPRSLLTPRAMAPAVMAATGAVTMLEAVLLARGDGVALALGGFALPTVATALVAWSLAEGNWSRAALSALGVACAHAALLALVTEESGLVLFVVGVVLAITLALAAPMLAACSVLGRSRALDAGDTLLGVAGVWFAAEQLLAMTVVGRDLAAFAPGLALAVAALAMWGARARWRRAWAARAVHGDLRGFRVREEPTADEMAKLSPLFEGRHVYGVLEELSVGPTAYRDQPVGVPVALAPIPVTP